MQNKKGFTLSEVLVTLGVLGLLAAILVPIVVSNRPSSSKLMFRKAYTVMENAISEAINNLAAYPVLTTTLGTDTVERGFNYTDVIPATMDIPASANKFCYVFVQKLNVVGSAACTDSTTNTFTTTDGIYWTINTPGSPFPIVADDSAYATYIRVDVNGPSKAPNCSKIALSNPTVDACSGKFPDIFQVLVRYDGKMYIDPKDTAASDILMDPTNNFKQEIN